MSPAMMSGHSLFPVAALGIGMFVAILFFAAIFVGIQIVIVYAVIHAIRKYDDPLPKVDARSGKGKMSEVPVEIKRWNWAAAFLPMVWGIYHNTWIFLLNFVPGVNLVWWIVMGIKGNEWAWRNNQWESVERFQRAQSRWRPVGILYFILSLLWVPYVIFVFALSASNISQARSQMYSSPSYYNDVSPLHNNKYTTDDENYDKYNDYDLDSSSSDEYPYNDNIDFTR